MLVNTSGLFQSTVQISSNVQPGSSNVSLSIGFLNILMTTVLLNAEYLEVKVSLFDCNIL